MHYYKYNGLGNDYIVIDPSEFNLTLSQKAIQLICDRNYGIGSDGILIGPLFQGNQIHLRIFNPDGSEAEKSGNGVRIFSRYLYEKSYVQSKSFSFLTKGGLVEIMILDELGKSIKVNMGKFTFDSSAIPVTGPKREVINESIIIDGTEHKITCLSLGNPHCVIPSKQISKELALSMGPKFENNPLFPNRTNVQFLKILDRNNIKIEIWERGAGYTLASGSSSCAASCVAYKLGFVDKHITVHMPGGNLSIDIETPNVHMTGPVASITYGNFSEEFIELIK